MFLSMVRSFPVCVVLWLTRSLAVSPALPRLFPAFLGSWRNPSPPPLNPLAVAQAFVASSFGVLDSSLVGDDFLVPYYGGAIKSRSQYLQGLGLQTRAITRAVPDLDLRPFAFVPDRDNPDKVWFKIRPRGTITGPFSFRGEVFLPTDQPIEYPVQQISITVRNGKVVELTPARVVDRLSGTTNGQTAYKGLLSALGVPPSFMDAAPPLVVLRRLVEREVDDNIGRSMSSSSSRPLPEPAMIAVTKQVLSSLYIAPDPALLADEVRYSEPLLGPLTKQQLLAYVARLNLSSVIPNLSLNLHSFHFDPLRPDTVWCTARGTAIRSLEPFSGRDSSLRYEGGPEVFSVSIGADGRVYRISAGYLADPTQGNTEAVSSVGGILQTVGMPRSWLETRTLTESLDMLRASLLPRIPDRTSSKITKNTALIGDPAASKEATPVAKVVAPATKIATPVAKVQTPVAKGTTSVANGTTPVAKVTTPVAKGTTPVARGTTPVAKVTTAVAKVTTPVAKVTTPVAKGTTPVAKGTTPVAKVTTPLAKVTTPVAKVQTPVVKVTTPVAKVTTPVAKVTTPVAKVTTPVAKVTTPVAKVTTPVAKVTTPVAKVTTPVAKVATPVAKGTTPVAKVQTPVVKVITPVAKGTTPVAKVAKVSTPASKGTPPSDKLVGSTVLKANQSNVTPYYAVFDAFSFSKFNLAGGPKRSRETADKATLAKSGRSVPKILSNTTNITVFKTTTKEKSQFSVSSKNSTATKTADTDSPLLSTTAFSWLGYRGKTAVSATKNNSSIRI